MIAANQNCEQELGGSSHAANAKASVATTVLGTLLLASHAFSPARQLRPSTRLAPRPSPTSSKPWRRRRAMLVTKWKTGVENDIALGFCRAHAPRPVRAAARSRQKAYFPAYRQCGPSRYVDGGPEAIAKTLGEDWKGARVYGILRNSETQAAVSRRPTTTASTSCIY